MVGLDIRPIGCGADTVDRPFLEFIDAGNRQPLTAPPHLENAVRVFLNAADHVAGHFDWRLRSRDGCAGFSVEQHAAELTKPFAFRCAVAAPPDRGIDWELFCHGFGYVNLHSRNDEPASRQALIICANRSRPTDK